jgi:ATP-binding cassette subfamily A (ABC1) protein 3
MTDCRLHPVVLVDECTSGVDPLSRRALWRTLSAVRHTRTVVFTTHFLDEADLLADDIAILAAPGRLVAHGPPVRLKAELGRGYTVTATFASGVEGAADLERVLSGGLLARVREIAPATHVAHSPPNRAAFHLGSRDSAVVEQVLRVLDDAGVAAYDVQGTSIEDIFLDLMHGQPESIAGPELEKVDGRELEKAGGELVRPPSVDYAPGASSGASSTGGKSPVLPATGVPPAALLQLSPGRKTSALSHARTIFHKRALIVRRSWFAPLVMLIVAIAGACVPLFFMAGRPQSCAKTFFNATSIPLYLPYSPYNLFAFADRTDDVLASPPGLVTSLGNTTRAVVERNVTDNATFVQTIQTDFLDLSRGGISLDASTGVTLVAWEASPPGLLGPVMLNLASNALYQRALNATGDGTALILANYEPFPAIDAQTLVALKWVAFFGAAMVYFQLTVRGKTG